MRGRQEAAQKAWATIRQRYGKGEIAKKAWATRKFNMIKDLTEEEYYAYIAEQHRREYETTEHKRIRGLIRQAGGINDKDYECIPRWSKRKEGRTMDQLVSELAESGVPVTCADDLYELLQEVSA